MSANPAIAVAPIGPQSAAHIERRKHNRQALEALGLLSEQTDAAFRAQLQVELKNISPGGIGFDSPVSIRPGAHYAMRIGTGPLHLKARLQVISSRPRQDGRFQIGARFV